MLTGGPCCEIREVHGYGKRISVCCKQQTAQQISVLSLHAAILEISSATRSQLNPIPTWTQLLKQLYAETPVRRFTDRCGNTPTRRSRAEMQGNADVPAHLSGRGRGEIRRCTGTSVGARRKYVRTPPEAGKRRNTLVRCPGAGNGELCRCRYAVRAGKWRNTPIRRARAGNGEIR